MAKVTSLIKFQGSIDGVTIDKNGTVKMNHFRTEANDTDSDNYTAIGNVNPYTDEKGTKRPAKDIEVDTSDRDETQ